MNENTGRPPRATTETAEAETPATDETAPVIYPAVIVVPAGGLVFVNAEGRPLLSINETDSGAAFELYNAAGQSVARVMTLPDGTGWIAVQHPDGPAAAALMSHADAGSFGRFDTQGNVVSDGPDPLALDPALLPWPGGHHLN